VTYNSAQEKYIINCSVSRIGKKINQKIYIYKRGLSEARYLRIPYHVPRSALWGFLVDELVQFIIVQQLLPVTYSARQSDRAKKSCQASLLLSLW
jgi:hypothetical protein